WLADKIVSLRIFEDAEGKMNRGVADVDGGVLVVSQFTLYGDCAKGRRPSFIDAAAPEAAIPLYEAFVEAVRLQGTPTATGRFGALGDAEFASMAPGAGSAYAYAYATMGELFGWIIGWDLVLEYAVGAGTVANGWSGYFQSLLLKCSLVVPMALSGAPHKCDQG